MTRVDRSIRILAVAAVVAVTAALVMAWRAPEERVMGSAIRILYVHAGAAWTAYLAYVLTAVGAGGWLIRREPRWDRLAVSAAELGVVLTTVTLATGSLWGRVVSQWWWNWGDVRLVVTLLLWFLYVAYLIVRQAIPGSGGRTISAILALLGIPVMVLNHFAVTWWQRAHPASVVLNPAGPAVSDELLAPLLMAQLAYALVFATLILMRVRVEVVRDAVPADQS